TSIHSLPIKLQHFKQNRRKKSQASEALTRNRGGFAKCYEIIDMETNNVFAGKIVSKKLMMKHNQKEKMSQEISIHRSLSHKNVVKFHSFFDDSFNVYIVLELCKKRQFIQVSVNNHSICTIIPSNSPAFNKCNHTSSHSTFNKYIATNQNCADIATRGISSSKLNHHKLWWTGLDFEWP
uniref:Protein kinase domain-containing protein n=1 Tax=Megaselia scalaris TaxID=36166 RepID=T1GRR4_MEGSC